MKSITKWLFLFFALASSNSFAVEKADITRPGGIDKIPLDGSSIVLILLATFTILIFANGILYKILKYHKKYYFF